MRRGPERTDRSEAPPRQHRRRRLLVALAVLAVGALGIWVAEPSDRAPVPEPLPEGTGGAPAGPRSSARDDEIPRTRLARGHVPAAGASFARVRIPKIGVDAPVIKLGLNSDGTLQVPKRAGDTGWWSGGSFPGRRGPAVIAGHVESTGGPAVFFRLRELRAGDQVLVEPRGKPSVRFVVERRLSALKGRFPTRRVYADTPGPTLRLITCTGDFDRSTGHYRSNLIVFARRA